jgi:hypothetical protein
MESQHSIAKSGYSSFANWVASAVNQECQHVNTDFGVIIVTAKLGNRASLQICKQSLWGEIWVSD